MPDGTVTITFVATATDGSGVPPTIDCDPPSGSVFAVGTTSVTCTATDAAGNTVSQSFTVTVEDKTAPELTVPTEPVFEQIQGPGGAIVNFDNLVSATDTVDPSPIVTCTPASGSLFAAGDTAVSCTATDASGNYSFPNLPASSWIVEVDESDPDFTSVVEDPRWASWAR